MADETYDVAVIGYGPVGMAMAALLGRAGHRVVVLERYDGLYNLPRAAIFDDETMRTFAKIGISDALLPKLHVQRNYEWRNGAGELLIEHDFAEMGRSGWAEWYMMYQPDLEDALDRVCRELPTVAVRFGARVDAITQTPDAVQLSVAGATEPVTAAYVIACDGGNSFARGALGVTLDDYGFSEPWLVCDFAMRRPGLLPTARQVCDPAQPIAIIALGHEHHRFSFMLDSADSFAAERDPERVWGRVARYLAREDAELVRIATYTFRSLVADRWRDRRVLLAGDAAHQMPPFLGQGMCSGVRDALNLSFKLDLVLAGRQPDTVLDTYQSEREEHVRAVIVKGIELGRVQTMRDPVAAAARDARLLADRQQRTAPEKLVFPPLGPGLFGTGDGARELFPQATVAVGGRTGRFDDVLGYGWVVLARAESTGSDALRVVRVPAGEATDEQVRDCDGGYTDWLNRHGCDAVAVRPDFHVWGTASGPDAVRRLVAELDALQTGTATGHPVPA